MEDDSQLQPLCLHMNRYYSTHAHKHAYINMHTTHMHTKKSVSVSAAEGVSRALVLPSPSCPLTASYSRWRLSVRNLYWCVLCRLIPQSSACAAVARPVLTNSRCFLLCAKSKANKGQRKINTMLPHPQLVQQRQLKFPAPFLTTCTLRGSR